MSDPMKAAASLVRSGWTQAAFARDGRGNVVRIMDPDANRFSLVGALFRACDGLEAEAYGAALPKSVKERLNARLGSETSWADWNDAKGRTPDEVARVLEGA